MNHDRSKLREALSKLLIVVAVLATASVMSCDRATNSESRTASPSPASADDLRIVQEVIAAQFNLKPDAIAVDKTFAQLNADELDLVEIILETEDRLKITLPDEALEKVSGTSKPGELVSELTVTEFASAVTAAREEAKAAGNRSGH